MFCPKCGTDNMNEAKFCRACGMDISVVPMVLTGELNATLEENPKKMAKALKEKKEVEESMNWEGAMSSFFTGIAFLIIFLGGAFFFRSAFMIWVWFIIPALACVGSGLGKMFQLKHREKLLLAEKQTQTQTQTYTPLIQRPNVAQLPRRDTNEFIPAPPSITENTTRHLGAEAPTRIFDKDE
jgi:hypothetical protein